jgi:Transposase DDE domain group 1
MDPLAFASLILQDFPQTLVLYRMRPIVEVRRWAPCCGCVRYSTRVYGQQEHSSYNGHFESTCYHPLLLFNVEGDCLAAKRRPGNVHSAEDWAELLLPEIERQQELGKEVVGTDALGRLGQGRSRVLFLAQTRQE